MPKLLVLLYGDELPTATLADCCVDGAKSVRFTEVDIRVGASEATAATRSRKRFASTDQLHDYDGVILICPAASDLPTELSSTLDAWEEAEEGAFTNTVFSGLAGDDTKLLGRVARLGGIIVAGPRGISEPELRARQLGTRVATVVSWIRHALAHENSEQRDHHDHPHDAEHRHAH